MKDIKFAISNQRTENGPKTMSTAVILLFIFLSMMNFFAKSFYLLFICFALLCLFGRVYFGRSSLLLLSLSLLMMIYDLPLGIDALKGAAPFLTYTVGFSLVMRESAYDFHKEGEKRALYGILSAAAFGSYVHFMLNFLINSGRDIGRNTYDIFSKEVMSATGQAAIGCIMCGFSIALILSPARRHSIFTGAAFLLSILAYDLQLASRALVVIMAIVFGAGFVFVYKCCKNGKEKKHLWLLICSILSIALITVIADPLGIWGKISSSELFARLFGADALSIIDSGRKSAKLCYLGDLLFYPFGGLNMRESYGYAHGLYLDGYDRYGIIFLVLAIFITLRAIRLCAALCKNRSYPVYQRAALLCVFTAITCEFFIEPILEGMSFLFSFYVMLLGAAEAAFVSAREEETEKRKEREKKGVEKYEDTSDKYPVRQRQHGENSPLDRGARKEKRA